jgi:transposase-like protein
VWPDRYRLSAGGTWRSVWQEFVPFLEFPAELRKVVYTRIIAG